MATHYVNRRIKAVAITLMAVLLALAAFIAQPTQQAQADAASENMQVDVSVTGNPNGPYNITITAQQLTANGRQQLCADNPQQRLRAYRQGLRLQQWHAAYHHHYGSDPEYEFRHVQ